MADAGWQYCDQVGRYGHSCEDEGTLSKTKEMLDDMHKRKINILDSIYVINIGGYIGGEHPLRD